MQNECNLHLTAAIEAIARGAMTSAQWMRACVARIDEFESRIDAFVWLDCAGAMTRAQALDLAPPTRLRGAPLAVKDVIDVGGMPTQMGSVAYRDNVPSVSAAVVDRLLGSGAVALGKTVTAELAFYFPGKTRNPWNPAHTPGGSSSGSAAAVAAGFVAAALGTQTNGSIIRPAAYCGCVGFKPTFGRVPRDGVLRFSETLDHVGFFSRAVSDAALLYAVCADHDPDRADSDTAADSSPARRGAAEIAPRLIAVRTSAWPRAEEYAQAHFLGTIATLRAAGARIEERELPETFAGAHALTRTIMYAEGARSFAALKRTHAPLLSATLHALIDEGAAIDDARVRGALGERRALIELLHAFVDGADAIITPPATGEAPATLASTGDPSFCTLWTLCGAPAITLPSGRGPRGLPLGTQLVGAPRADRELLTTARWCEKALGWEARLADGG